MREDYPAGMVDAALISKVKTLSVAERLELIGAVWESFSGNDVPISEEEKALLDARLTDMETSPEDESAWSEVQVRLRSRLLRPSRSVFARPELSSIPWRMTTRSKSSSRVSLRRLVSWPVACWHETPCLAKYSIRWSREYWLDAGPSRDHRYARQSQRHSRDAGARFFLGAGRGCSLDVQFWAWKRPEPR